MDKKRKRFVILLPEQRLARHTVMLEALIVGREGKIAREAVEGLRQLGQNDLLGSTPGSQLREGQGRRLEHPAGKQEEGIEAGFDDPLSGHRQGRPRSTVVGLGKLPTQDDLTGQDSSRGGTYYGDGGRRGMVWAERSTMRTSRDGSQTWGSTLYRDTGGNHWRFDYHDQRTGGGTPDTSDDGFTSKETLFDGHNKPVSTTYRETLPDGNAKETTTDHQTGETTTRTGTTEEIFPERSQPAEGGGGDKVAPRGWSNSITGAVQNPGLATSNNQVNPGPEPAQTTPSQPLFLDPKDLAINPAQYDAPAAGTPRDIRREHDDVNEVDPPRPQ